MNLIAVIGVQDVTRRFAATLGEFIELATEILALAVPTGEGTGIQD